MKELEMTEMNPDESAEELPWIEVSQLRSTLQIFK